MTKERMFYIAYRICDYVRSTNMQHKFEEYEFCMYVSNVANDIKYAIKYNEINAIQPYYDMLDGEVTNLLGNSGLENYVMELKELIVLLDECKVYIGEK